MTVRALIHLCLALGAGSMSGCLALGPLATVATIEKVEQVTGGRLDPTPGPGGVDNAQTPRLDAVPSDVPSGLNASAVPSTAGSAGPASSASPGAATPDPRLANLVTMAMFNQIQAGMSLDDVETIIGRPGQLVPNSRLEMYVWYNPNGSSLKVIMSAKRVAQKFQERLS